MFCVVCQDDVAEADVRDALECLQCSQVLHETCYNDYSEIMEEKREDGIAPCPSCRNAVTMQAVKHRQWAALLNVIHAIRHRSDAGLLTDIPTVSGVLSGILQSTYHSGVVVTYVCKCLYSISVGRDEITVNLPCAAVHCIARCLFSHPDDDELSLWSCAAMYTLSRSAENDVVSAIPAIVSCMQTHKAIAIIPYYAAMTFRVCLTANAAAANAIVRTALKPCLDALWHHRSPLVNRAVSWLVLSLALLPDQKPALGVAGCLQAMADVVLTHANKNDETMLYATSAIANLLYGSPANKSIACDINLIGTAVTILGHASAAGVIVEACDTIACLTRHGADMGVHDGVVCVWEVWRRNEHDAVIVKACMAAVLAFHDRGTLVDLVHANEITSMACQALQRFTAIEYARVVKPALKIISRVTSLPGGNPCIGCLDALSLTAIMQNACCDDRVHKHACSALTRLLRDGTVCTSSTYKDDAVIDAMLAVFFDCFHTAPRQASVMFRSLADVSGSGIRAAFCRSGNCEKLRALNLADAIADDMPIRRYALATVIVICLLCDYDYKPQSGGVWGSWNDPLGACPRPLVAVLVSSGIFAVVAAQTIDGWGLYPTPGLERDALRTVCLLCRACGSYQSSCIMNDGTLLDVLPSLMHEFASGRWSLEVTLSNEMACTIVRLLSYGGNALALLKHPDGLSVVCNLMAEYKDDAAFWMCMGVLFRRVGHHKGNEPSWSGMLQADSDGWCGIFGEVLRHCQADFATCRYLCTVLDTVMDTTLLSSIRVVETLLDVLTDVLRMYSVDVALAWQAAGCLLRLGDVYDALFCQSEAWLAISSAFDQHPDDETLFAYLQHACTIQAGYQFHCSVSQLCGRVF